MGLYNFKAQFVPFILDGRKTHTIRAERKYPDKAGNPFHAYTGLRTKGARKLLTSTVIRVEDIAIRRDYAIFVDSILLNEDEREALASRDGFRDFAEMMAFWIGRLPFKGHIIHWRAVPRGRKSSNTQP